MKKSNPQNPFTLLSKIAEKDYRLILGMLSGTSMDGLDIGLWKIGGYGWETSFEMLHFETVEFSLVVKNAIQKVFHKNEIDVRDLMVANRAFAEFCGDSAILLLKKWKIDASQIDLIATHGQTIFHHPSGEFQGQKFPTTLQIGDGDFLAQKTGIITISDFRQRHIAAGGEGAPLSAYADAILMKGKSENTVFLNLGGIANFSTIVHKGESIQMMSTDVGPANALLDAWISVNHNTLTFDKDGVFSAKGKVDKGLLERFLTHEFFKRPFPKSTGREEFSLEWLKEMVRGESFENVSRTLVQLCVESLKMALNELEKFDGKIFVSGGGWRNPTLRKELKNQLPDFEIASLEEIGIDPDAKETLIFALIANECVGGNPDVFSEVGLLPVRMGKLSL